MEERMTLNEILAEDGLQVDMNEVAKHAYYGKFLSGDTMIEYPREWARFDENELDFCNPISYHRLITEGLVRDIGPYKIG